ncbi:MAG: hypothetical protein DMG91_06720 [Acidobacteria bacterium]|jgi:hypothetical protein|nr:MAG: hypothetical protein DMG91_06720 [Acidobacteriota bacterium]
MNRTFIFIFLAALTLAAQQGGSPDPLQIISPAPNRAFLRQPYEFQLAAQGGVPPYQWDVSGGVLPRGMKLGSDGLISGAPVEIGDFQIRVTVTDSGHPARELSKEIVLHVIAPLLVEWSRYPKITGQRIEGAARVSNQTGQDFDFTIVVLAVNEIGRATAIGYQHFTLTQGTVDLEIPFGENLPRGSYEVNLDAVGEVAATDIIYRSRLVTSERLQVQVGP